MSRSDVFVDLSNYGLVLAFFAFIFIWILHFGTTTRPKDFIYVISVTLVGYMKLEKVNHFMS
jgi:hypothetical protein